MAGPAGSHLPVFACQLPGVAFLHHALLLQVALVPAQHHVGALAVGVGLQLACRQREGKLRLEALARPAQCLEPPLQNPPAPLEEPGRLLRREALWGGGQSAYTLPGKDLYSNWLLGSE